MRVLYTLFFLLVGAAALHAQPTEVVTVLENGPVADRINLVFLADGYIESEQEKFITDVNNILSAMFAQSPLKEYKPYFNVYAIKVISVESGATHPRTSPDSDCAGVPAQIVNNYFGSTFDYGNIHRLLYPMQMTKVMTTLANHFPEYDQGFVVVNSPYYGGAGGTVATCSDHAASSEVAIHEIGHSFAGLADEYWAGSQYAAEKPNMTQQTNAALVKWKNWMGTAGVGIYPHSGDASWKKPHTNCKMEKLNVPFCRVCSETFVERFHSLVKPLIGFSPSDKKLSVDPETEQTLDFSLMLVPPTPNTLKITWEKNYAPVAKNVETLSLSSLDIGSSTLIRATVRDTTILTRSDVHAASHVYQVEWQIRKGAITGIEVQARQYDLSVYPNPSGGDLKFSYTLSKSAPVKVSLVDHTGRAIRTLVSARQDGGEYTYAFTAAQLGAAPGAYTVHFTFGKTSIPVKVIIQ